MTSSRRASEHEYFGDRILRPALRARLRAEHEQDPDAVMIEELGVCRGQARIDLAVIKGSLHGYEIKSDRDTLRRLESQVIFYGKVLDRATLVVGDRYLAEAQRVLPSWWGILHVRCSCGDPDFKEVRAAERNPHRDPRALVELLWLDQATQLLIDRGVARGVRGKPRSFVWDRVCQHFATDEIAKIVRECLKARARR